MFTMALPFKLGQLRSSLALARTPNLNLILWHHDRIEIDNSFSVMAVAPQTPKCHHNLGCASVVVTFGSLWCHSHDLKLGINSFNNTTSHTPTYTYNDPPTHTHARTYIHMIRYIAIKHYTYHAFSFSTSSIANAIKFWGNSPFEWPNTACILKLNQMHCLVGGIKVLRNSQWQCFVTHCQIAYERHFAM